MVGCPARAPGSVAMETSSATIRNRDFTGVRAPDSPTSTGDATCAARASRCRMEQRTNRSRARPPRSPRTMRSTRGIVAGGAPRHQQRQEMLFGRMRARGLRRLLPIVDQRRRVVRGEPLVRASRRTPARNAAAPAAADCPSSRAGCASCGPSRRSARRRPRAARARGRARRDARCRAPAAARAAPPARPRPGYIQRSGTHAP